MIVLVHRTVDIRTAISVARFTLRSLSMVFMSSHFVEEFCFIEVTCICGWTEFSRKMIGFSTIKTSSKINREPTKNIVIFVKLMLYV